MLYPYGFGQLKKDLRGALIQEMVLQQFIEDNDKKRPLYKDDRCST